MRFLIRRNIIERSFISTKSSSSAKNCHTSDIFKGKSNTVLNQMNVQASQWIHVCQSNELEIFHQASSASWHYREALPRVTLYIYFLKVNTFCWTEIIISSHAQDNPISQIVLKFYVVSFNIWYTIWRSFIS
jgi:hypothetical protein